MKKILVIDDDKNLAETLGRALRSSFHVTVATDGESGVQAALAHQPHLVLCDINMEGLNGYGTLAKLRAHPVTRTTPCILMTAEASPKGMRRGMQLGADDYLPKPFEMDELHAAVNVRLARHDRTQDEAEEKFRDLQQTFANAIPNQLLGPINDLAAQTELMSKGRRHFEPEDIISMSHDAHRSAVRVRQQIENCLLLAGLLVADDSSPASPWRQRTRVHVLDVVQPTVVQKAKEWGRGNDLKLSLAYCQTQFNERALRKIVEEILDNALKYSPPGTPIEIRVFPEATQNTIEISDRGAGISPECIARLGAFMRGKQNLKMSNGCGVGLTIAKALAELNDGQLCLHARKGGGTTVRVTMPVLAQVQPK
ncbi:MAG TPA: response regulator [Methylomirabilota bacterium]|nr:response regulator [Methylomirabilota bacterium]